MPYWKFQEQLRKLANEVDLGTREMIRYISAHSETYKPFNPVE